MKQLVAYTPCLKYHVHVYVGIVCIINLLNAPVGNVLMRLGCQGKGTDDLSRQWLSLNLETFIMKAILVPGNSFLFW